MLLGITRLGELAAPTQDNRSRALVFQAAPLALDLAAVAYFLATTFIADAPWVRAVDLVLGSRSPARGSRAG